MSAQITRVRIPGLGVLKVEDPAQVKPKVDIAFTPVAHGITQKTTFKRRLGVREMKLEDMAPSLYIHPY